MIGPWCATLSGRRYYPQNPQPAQFSLTDVASGLGNTCRFGGQCPRFYSVAEHSVLVARVVERMAPALAFAALMHDAAEAYLGDVPTPLKLCLPSYETLERATLAAIFEAFAIPGDPYDSVIKRADLAVLRTEVVQFEMDWGEAHPQGAPADVALECWDPAWAQGAFLAAFSRYRRLLGRAP